MLAAGAAVLLAACAPSPSFRSAVKARYPGFVQALPQMEASADDPWFQYVPGTVLAGALQEEATAHEAELWSFAGASYCTPGAALAHVRPVALKPTTLHYHVDLGVGGRASHGARRAAADLDLAPRELRLLRRVSVRILRPVRYALGRRELSAARAAVAASCPGLFAASARLQQIDAILVADVAVEVRFKANVSFEDRMALLGRLGVSFGFGAGQATGYAWSGKNVVFAARLGHVRPGSNGRKQASAR